MSEGQFKQLLEEQIQQKRSEEFDDIWHVLDQPDEEIKKDTSWKILELIYEAENKNTKRKRQTADKDSDRKQKKRKNIQSDCTLDTGPCIVSEDCNLTVPQSGGVLPYLNDTLKTNSVVSKQNESKKKSPKLLRTDLDGNADTTKDMSKTSRQDLTKTGGGTHDEENAENDKVSDDECENSKTADQNGNMNDGDDDNDEDNDINYDDNHDDNDNKDDDDDDDDDDGDDDDNVDDQEESEQPVTYGN